MQDSVFEGLFEDSGSSVGLAELYLDREGIGPGGSLTTNLYSMGSSSVCGIVVPMEAGVANHHFGTVVNTPTFMADLLKLYFIILYSALKISFLILLSMPCCRIVSSLRRSNPYGNPILTGIFYFTNPGHYKSFEWLRIGEVWLITMSEAFLKENVHHDVFKEFPFLLAEKVPP